MKLQSADLEINVNDTSIEHELMELSTRMIMKVKGEKHSVTKVKKMASVDIEKLNSIQDFVEYSVTRQRFDQAIGEVFGNPIEMDVKRLGDLLRWVVKDIMAEEMDTMVENGLEPKDVNKYISTKTREMFFTELNKKQGIS